MSITQQETFDTVVRHLRTQGCKSIADGACMYRGPDGLKCAVGCLIPDDDYRPEMESQAACALGSVGRLLHDLGHDLSLINALQLVHDSWNVENWESAFQETADRFGLRYS